MIESILSAARQMTSLLALKQQAQSQQQVANVVERATDDLQRTVEAQANASRGRRIDIYI
jgi:flagellar motor protein MotB